MWKIDRALVEITRYGNQYRAERLEPEGLKCGHASYLTEICREPGISQDTLAQRICISKSSVARQVAALEEDGFLTRTPATEDKRVMQLYPTEKTLALFPQVSRMLCTWEDWLTGDLTQEEKTQLIGLLQRMKARARLWMEAP